MAAEDALAAPPEVVCRGLAKTYRGRRAPLEALRPFDAVFRPGETTALVGPSGCGKSTILRLIAGLEAPSAGTVEIGGAPPLAVRRRAGLAVGFQDPSLLPWRSVRGNVALARRLARQPADPAAVERVIALVGLAGFEDVQPAALSGGMRQRAAIARCLVTRPGLLLLDEPFGAVDELTRQRLAQDLPRLWEARGTTTLFVTHSVSEAVMIADRILVLSPRPAGIVEDIAIPLDRPREPALAATPLFHDLTDRVSAALARGAADDERPLAAE
jgi:NitT/TauT family transport system ATP-binding protein